MLVFFIIVIWKYEEHFCIFFIGTRCFISFNIRLSKSKIIQSKHGIFNIVVTIDNYKRRDKKHIQIVNL